MKNLYALMMLSLILMVVSCQGGTQTDSSTEPEQTLSGPYLGMTPPGEVPEIFAPGIVADIYREHSGAIFSPDGNELFWTAVINPGQQPLLFVVLHMKQENGVWSGPELAPFVRDMKTHINSISPDGKRLYMISTQPADGDPPDAAGARRTWIVERTENGWSKQHVDPDLNPPATRITDVQEARSGNRYGFGTIDAETNTRGLMVSRLVDGKYMPPEPLWPVENPDHLDHSITVDPDERFVIFASRRPATYSAQDLYISYRQADGTWGPAINLGEKINSTGEGLGWPHLSPDGKYLFFTSFIEPYKQMDEARLTYAEIREISTSIMNGWSNIFWVSTSFVEELKPVE